MAPEAHFVEVPGYREILRSEAEGRDGAFLPDTAAIAGVPVRSMSAWHLNALTAVRNGFVCPCIFDDERERAEHAMQFIWCVSTAYDLPKRGEGFWPRWKRAFRKAFMAHRLANTNARVVYKDLSAYLERTFYDGPKPSGDDPKAPRATLHTSWIVSMIDEIVGAGYPFTEEQLLHMPLIRLWQYHKRAQKRLYPKVVKLANPSDKWFNDRLQEQNDAAAAAAKGARN